MLGFNALGVLPVGDAPSGSIAANRTAHAVITDSVETLSTTTSRENKKGRGRPKTANTFLVRRKRRQRTPLFYRDASIRATATPNPTVWQNWFFPQELITATVEITDQNETVLSEAVIVSTGGIVGDADIADQLESVTATGQLLIQAAASIADPNEEVAATARLALLASAEITDQNETVTSAATLPIQGEASIADPNDELAASGVVQNALVADAAIQDPNETVESVVALGPRPVVAARPIVTLITTSRDIGTITTTRALTGNITTDRAA